MIVTGYYDHAENLIPRIDSVDLFIGGISSEERCSRGYSLLVENGIQINDKIIFYFEEVLSAFSRSAVAQRFNQVFNTTNQERLEVKLYDERSGLLSFRELLETRKTSLSQQNIVVDFSVLVKPYFFLLIKHLLDMHSTRLIFIYTQPEFYKGFTRGSMVANDIPGYSGTRRGTKRDALAILLGFEGNRSISVYNEIDPDLTIPINGFPSYKPEFKDVSILENKELLADEEISKNLRFAPANDPFETKSVLCDLYSKFSDRYNFSIAPLGTKPMGLGACFFALENPTCRVIYPYPLKYHPKSSSGWNETWVYVSDFS